MQPQQSSESSESRTSELNQHPVDESDQASENYMTGLACVRSGDAKMRCKDYAAAKESYSVASDLFLNLAKTTKDEYYVHLYKTKLQQLVTKLQKCKAFLEGKAGPREEEKKGPGVVPSSKEEELKAPLSEKPTTVPGGHWDRIICREVVKKQILDSVITPFNSMSDGHPRSVLFYGPVGCGKTIGTRAVAERCGAQVEILDMVTLNANNEEAEKLLKYLGEVGKREKPLIVLMDYIDTVNGPAKDKLVKKLEALTKEGAKNRVMLVGISASPQTMSKDLLNVFAAKIYFPLPSAEERKSFFRSKAYDMKNSLTEKDLDELTTKTDGFSFAELEALLGEASRGPPTVTRASFDAPLTSILPTTPAAVVKEMDKWAEKHSGK